MTQDWRDSVELTQQQSLVRRSIRDLCAEFGDEYWRERDRTATYPTEFVDALAADGWLGMLVPEEYGGVGMSTGVAMSLPMRRWNSRISVVSTERLPYSASWNDPESVMIAPSNS